MKARYQPTPAILLNPFAASATLMENHKTNIPQEVITPPVVETSIGDLHFNDGMPSAETANKIYDQLDFIRGVETYLNALPAVSMFAIRKGFREAGVKDNDVIIFSGLMDSQSLFLTANCDTIYFWTE